MPSRFPPRPSKRATVALAVVALVTFLYSVVVAAQVLLWFALVGLAIGLYLTYLLIVAVFRLVEAVERIAAAMEADSAVATPTDTGPSAKTASRDESNADRSSPGGPNSGGSASDESSGSDDPGDRPGVE